MVCTARPYHSVKQVGLFDVFTPDALICANGALVLAGEEIVHKDVFDKVKFEKLCELVISLGLTMEATLAFDRFLIAPETEYVSKLYATYYEDTPEVMDYHNQEIITAMLFAPEEYDAQMLANLPEGVSYFRFDTYGVDIFDIPHYKGNGVKIVLNHYGFSKEDALAFGDDLGDVSMFEEVKYGFAMANGKQELLEKAYAIIPPVFESGIKQAFINYKIGK